MTKAMQQQLEAEQQRHEQVLLVLCDQRAAEFRKAWGTKRQCKLDFGMGSVYVEVDHKQAYEEDYPLIEKFIRDVEEITDTYHLACPDKVEIG